jgi:negative regulator of sigma E activity
VALLSFGLRAELLVAAPLALQGQGILSGIPAWLHLLSAYGPLLAAVGVTAVVILAVILIARRYGPESLSHREKQTRAP